MTSDMTDDSTAEVLYDVRGRVAVLTLNRPDAHNAYTGEMFHALEAAFDQAATDDAVRAVVVTGAGKSFSAGGDLKLMQAREGMFAGGPVELRRKYVDGVQRVPRRLARFDKPVVAAVNGAAVGAGLDLACMCDVRIAAQGARFGSPFVRLGLVPGDGGAYFLARIVGFAKALELMLTGRLITAEEAERMGLVNEVVADELVVAAALSKAEAIAENAPLAVQLTKAAAYRSWNASLEEALELASTYQSIAQTSEDHLEGIAAALEKRPPKFRGR
jgi:2-(1,2-epoxy-1,2-dihydrophenyl)acetyl-CoA isomerase